MIRIIKYLAIALVTLAAIFAGVGILLPAAVHVERGTVIQAEPAEIFLHLNDLHRFTVWSPWSARDPATQFTFSGPDQGEGAAMTWQSEKLGAGRQQIVRSAPYERVVYALAFGDMGSAEAGFVLAPEGGGTRVTWTLDSSLSYNPIARWFGLLFPYLIGADYEQGLERLKTLVEKGAL